MENEQTALTLQDLKTLHEVVQVSSSRGAFRAEELSAVGAIYDKLTKFLSNVEAQQAETPEQETAAEENSEDLGATEIGEKDD